MTNTIICPYCHTSIEITQALRQQIEQEIAVAIKKQTEAELRKELSEKNSLEMEDLKKQLAEKDKKVSELRSQELSLREEKRKIEEEKKELKLEVARQLDEGRKKIEESILKQAAEEHRLKDLEKEKKIADLEKLAEELRRKASQGSQQLQGEVQELDLEATLINVFPHDAIEPVGKGVRGADVQQVVRSPRGVVCGVILWESKRTKAWSDEWIGKLKDDLRATAANVPVIVTSMLPKEVGSGIGLKDGVWICNFTLVVPLATLLRKNLLDIGYQKAIAAHQGEKADLLYEYVTGHEFRQQVEALVEVYQDMHIQILREKAAFEKSWKARETHVTRLLTSTASVYGTMQGLVGSSLPQVKGLELLGEGAE